MQEERLFQILDSIAKSLKKIAEVAENEEKEKTIFKRIFSGSGKVEMEEK